MKFKVLRSTSFPKRFKAKPSYVTIGNFDGVHLGHQAMITDMVNKARADKLVPTVMTFEPLPREVFKPDEHAGRITPLADKLRIFRKLGVKRVYVQEFSPPFARLSPDSFVQHILVERLGAQKLYVGADFHFGHKRAGNVDYLRQNQQALSLIDIQVMTDVVHDGDQEAVRVSSTLVREKLAAGEMQETAALLGRPWRVKTFFSEDDQCVLWGAISRYVPVKNAVYWVKVHFSEGENAKEAILPVICRDNIVKIRPLGQIPNIPEGPVLIDFLEKMQELNV